MFGVYIDRTGPQIMISESDNGSSRTAFAADTGVGYDPAEWQWSEDKGIHGIPEEKNT